MTLNVRDFRSRVLRDSDIAILTPGKLLEGVLDDRPELAVLAVGHLGVAVGQPAPDAIGDHRGSCRAPHAGRTDASAPLPPEPWMSPRATTVRVGECVRESSDNPGNR